MARPQVQPPIALVSPEPERRHLGRSSAQKRQMEAPLAFQPIDFDDSDVDDARLPTARPPNLTDRIRCTTPTQDSDAQRKNCPRLDKRRRQICASGDLDGETSPTSSATPPMLPRDASCTSLEELEELTLLRARWLRSS